MTNPMGGLDDYCQDFMTAKYWQNLLCFSFYIAIVMIFVIIFFSLMTGSFGSVSMGMGGDNALMSSSQQSVGDFGKVGQYRGNFWNAVGKY